MKIDEEIWLEEGSESCSVTVINSSISTSHSTWQKDEKVISEYVRHTISEKAFTFNNVTRNDTGTYSVTANLSCHGNSKSRKIVGNFSLNVICKWFKCI